MAATRGNLVVDNPGTTAVINNSLVGVIRRHATPRDGDLWDGARHSRVF